MPAVPGDTRPVLQMGRGSLQGIPPTRPPVVARLMDRRADGQSSCADRRWIVLGFVETGMLCDGVGLSRYFSTFLQQIFRKMT